MIALIDCNSFYCSCERLFRPDLKDYPVGVASGKEGCFISCCQKLKALGVKVGTPVFKVRGLCLENDVKVFSSHFALYRNLSDRIMRILKTFGKEVEIYSVDEGFVDVSHISQDELQDYAKMMKEKIYREVGIPVGIGVGKTKTLAKAANFLAKKNALYQGVLVFESDDEIDRYLKEVPIGQVWGIGKKNSIKMRQTGIYSAYDLRHFENSKKILKIFTRPGLETQLELQGQRRFQLNPPQKKKQQIMHSRTEKNPVYDYKKIETLILYYCALACEKLRKQKSVAGKVSVYIRSNPYSQGAFYSTLKEGKLPAPSSDTRRVSDVALGALKEAFRKGIGFKKIGVILSDICDADEYQGELFSDFDDDKSEKLMNVIDFVNKKEGKATINFGVKKESVIRGHSECSQAFVSSWSELPKAW